MVEKLYCYVDESGQDTKGAYFLVAVAIVCQGSVSKLEGVLREIERETGRIRRVRVRKWTDTRLNEKIAYLERIVQLSELQRSIFYMSFRDTTDYTARTTLTIARSVSQKASGNYQAYILVDALNERERRRMAKGLREQGVRRKRIRGGRDESSALLRLADAMAGFIRDYEEGKNYAQGLYHGFVNQGIIFKLVA